MGSNVTSIRPEELTLKIELKVRVSSPEDKEYFVLPNGETQPGFLADMFDMLDMINKHLVTVNGRTASDYQKILQGNATL